LISFNEYVKIFNVTKNKKSLGEHLLEEVLINKDKLEWGLKEQVNTKEKIGETLVRLGILSQEDLIKTLSKHFGLPYLSLSEFPKIFPGNIGLPVKFMKYHKVFPLGIYNDKVRVAMADPLNVYTIDAIKLVSGRELDIHLSTEKDILEAIEQFFGKGNTKMARIIEDISEEEYDISAESLEEDVHHLRDLALEAPIIKLVNLVISRAVEERASDIHIEPFENNLHVRYRIDGILHEVESPPKRLQSAVISRVKIMAKLNIAERRLPQDGRIRLRVSGNEIDLRVSTIPTLYGESVVMRILDRTTAIISLENLGFPKEALNRYEELITRPYGILLVTGPTGSGKTTTLYASLNKINSSEKKIIAIEDPIEYQLEGINQIQVKPKIGLTFATGLRHIVRQDPDIIMVGEIRDLETADISIHSALTGHLVFSTLHTNDAPGAVTRLLDMGIESFLASSSLIGVLAQRLVRVICHNCKEPLVPSDDILQEIGGRVGTVIYHGAGCEECRYTGYKGRTGIFELMMITDDIRRLILDKTSANIIKEKALSHGMQTLRENGWQKVKKGITTIEEILRVTQEEDI
jgi:general secretion pathway protein E